MGIVNFITANWSQILVALFALYAASLSTLNYLDKKREEKEKKKSKNPKIKVESSWVYNGKNGRLQTIAINVSEQSVYLYKFEYCFLIREEFPVKLQNFKDNIMGVEIPPRAVKEVSSMSIEEIQRFVGVFKNASEDCTIRATCWDSMSNKFNGNIVLINLKTEGVVKEIL